MNFRQRNLNSVLAAFLLCLTPALSQAQQKVPILFDTDIGTDMDDAFALGLLLASPEVELRGVTTSGTDAETRAWMVCRFLTVVDKKTIPVAWGRPPQFGPKVESQYQYRYHPAVLFNRTSKPVKADAVEFMYEQLKADKGKITILATGPLTNVARLLEKYPDCQPWIKRIVVSGGVSPSKKDSKLPAKNPNIDLNFQAVQTILNSKVPVTAVPGTVQTRKLPPPFVKQIFQACTPLTLQIQTLYQLWDNGNPDFADAIAARLCFDEGFSEATRCNLTINPTKTGIHVAYDKVKGKDKVVETLDNDTFVDWLVKRLSAGEPALPKPPPNPSKLIPADKFPNRVHAFEDFETDIEKRWWLSGKLEKSILPPGGGRALRGVLTMDFDDLQGDTKTMYTAVVFNPVPGPPMGKKPRLSFRYWLKGTDTLRVQIYSLSKGYHRCLTLKGLPQEKWQSGTVDMTDVRRPDGSGGPLSENERIDDIQFYVDPRAELIIDDIVLYDAPAEGEKRPFPKQIHYTGLFDTGKQGKEWPGKFEIVKDGYFWNAAKSIPTSKGEGQIILVDLRGQRPLGESTHLFFRYHLTGTTEIEIDLLTKSKEGSLVHKVALKNLQPGQWDENEIAFVLSHEMGHVLLKHSINRLMASSAICAGLAKFPIGGLLGMGILHMTMELLNQGHSREQELEADKLAAQLTHYAGFDPDGGKRLLHRLGSIPSERWLGSTYFSSHPPMEARIENIERRLAQLRGKNE